MSLMIEGLMTSASQDEIEGGSVPYSDFQEVV